MLIHQFTTFPFGGAGTAAIRHHRELRRQEIDSRMFVRSVGADNKPETLPQTVLRNDAIFECDFLDMPGTKPTGFFAAIQERRRRKRICHEYETHLATRSKELETFSQAELYHRTRLRAGQAPHILHLHWISFLIDYPTFFGSLPQWIPVVWTLHDVNPFTGGCHFPGQCERFRLGCGRCPSVPDNGPYDLTRRAMRTKSRSLAGRCIHVVSPSRWMDTIARQSPVWPHGTSFHVIPYGIDGHAFRPEHRELAQQRLGLPSQAALIGFGADDIGNPRKGFAVLLNAIRRVVVERPVELVIFGRTERTIPRQTFPIHQLGFLDGPGKLANAYSAVDVLVLPSLEDNLPQTGLEAMACGTPVVGSNVGGIPDFVLPGQTGLLARGGDPINLGRQIGILISNPKLQQRFSANARRLIQQEFELVRQVRRHIDLYADIIRQSDRGRGNSKVA